MVFVKPTKVTLPLVLAIQRAGAFIGTVSLVHLFLYFLPTFENMYLDNVDSPAKDNSSTLEAITWNVALVVIFGVQHTIMARTWFKSFMNKILNNQYYYAQRGMYSLLSGILLEISLVYWKPINIVVLPYHGVTPLKYLSAFLSLFGLYMILQSIWDLVDDDIFGFKQLNKFEEKGQDMPTPFIMKRLSRIALCCRHPLYTGQLLSFSTSLFQKEITLGRLIFSVCWFVYVFIGSQCEEAQFRREDIKAYSKYKKLIPNQYIPNFGTLFSTSEKLEDFRQKVLKDD